MYHIAGYLTKYENIKCLEGAARIQSIQSLSLPVLIDAFVHVHVHVHAVSVSVSWHELDVAVDVDGVGASVP